MNPIIEFRNVTKDFRLYGALTAGSFRSFILGLPFSLKGLRPQRFTALKDVSFIINRGEVVGIIGVNGSGKSTTLGLIANVIKPTKGEVIVNERVSPLLELGGGFHPELTGRENIRLNGVLLGIPLKKIDEKLHEIIEFTEIGELIDQPIRTYSSGMLARLGFSIITQLEPKLLIIDEVLAVGDAAFREKCYKVMEDFKKQGVTILFVSHAAHDVRRICDRVIWIENHRIKMDGNVEEVVGTYESLK